MTDQELTTELIRAGRTIVVEPVSDHLVADVLTDIAAAPALTRRHRWLGWWRWLRSKRRRLITVVLAILLVAALTPPVRAAVREWLQIGGVLIRTGAPPSPAPVQSSPAGPPSPPLGGQELTLDQARAAVAFPIGVPAELGTPDRIMVSEDRRVVGMDWTIDGQQVHLDQFDGTMSWVFVKQNWKLITPTEIGGSNDAVWLAEKHAIAYVDRAGVERRETARLSGPSLIWQPTIDGRELTVRLEGIATLDRARTIAESLR